MAEREYLVAWQDPQSVESTGLRCDADTSFRVIEACRSSRHAVREPRKTLARNRIQPPQFRVEFHPPEARGEAARIRFEIDGRPAGELLETTGRYGSQWMASSLEPEFHAVGTGHPPTLREACKEVGRVAAQACEIWRDAPDRETAGPERATGMER